MKRLFVVAAVALLAWSQARPAQACGGFFCDRPSSQSGPVPIAQAAENVLFVMTKDPNGGAATVEAHIQIMYTGPASKFSWIVPVTSVPKVSVGADILFDRIEPPTRPSFSLSYQLEGNCRGISGPGAGCGSSAAGGSNLGAEFGVSVDGGPPGVDVLSMGSVGPYDYVVISAQDGGTLRTWLTDNGYYVSTDSGKIVDDYVAAQYSFVAVRLQNGQDTSAIRPIVLSLAATEACLPLKLTAIAATPDLRINVWVLAEARAVPINYAEIELNQAKLDWFTGGSNYDQLLKDAANEAQGNAFAVEYARPAASSTAWFTLPASARSDLEAAATPPAFVAKLVGFGLQPIGVVLQILRKLIPRPPTLAAQGVSEAAFYANIDYYWASNAAPFAPFDSVAAAAQIDTEVLTPMNGYRSLFQREGRLTRLATFISPEEMTKDPLFVANPTLPDVAPQHMAVAHVMCGDGAQACAAPVRVQIEDGSDVYFNPTSCMRYDRGDIDKLPASNVAWQRATDGDGQIVVDNRALITAALRVHNDAVSVPTHTSGDCGCATGGSPGFVLGLTLLAGGLALSRRRRRR